MMKVAYISTYLPQHCGIATYTDYLIHGIRGIAEEIEIKVVAEKGAKAVRPVPTRNGSGEKKFEVVPCWDRKENYVEPIITHTRDADIVHIQHEYGIYKFDDRLPELIKQITQKKVITLHCIRPSQFSERGAVDENFAKRIAQLADRVIVHLPSQSAILTRLGIPGEKIQLIAHGTEINNTDRQLSREKLRLPIDGNIILIFGFVKRHKCMHVVIDALKEIIDKVRDVYLFVAGGLASPPKEEDKDYVECVNRRIEELGLTDRVIFLNPFFTNDVVPYIFGASDIVVFPYYEEDRSASGSFHLAIGSKKPVIASRIPKFEELKNICDELLVLPHNSSGIAKIALRIFLDLEFRQYVVARTDDYRDKTSWQSVAKQHLELYNEF